MIHINAATGSSHDNASGGQRDAIRLPYASRFMRIDSSLIRFLIVGVSNTAIGMSVIYLAWKVMGLGDVVSNIAGYAIGFLWSYMANRLWTFRDRSAAVRSFILFLLVCAVAYAANLAVVLGSRKLLGEGSFLPHVAGMAVYTAVGYLGSRFFAFRRGALESG